MAQPERWNIVSQFTRGTYACGAVPGEHVRLRVSFQPRDHQGQPVGPRREAGEIWTVLRGSEQDPTALWLRSPDGEVQTWSDDEDFWRTFERAASDE